MSANSPGEQQPGVRVTGLVIGGVTAGTVRIGGRPVDIGSDGAPAGDQADPDPNDLYAWRCTSCGSSNPGIRHRCACGHGP